MERNIKHPHYGPEFARLAEAALRALLRHEGSLAPGQYMLLHRIESRRGNVYVPLFVHVFKQYEGKSALVHPLPLDNTLDPVARRFGLSIPYGVAFLKLLEDTLNAGSFSPADGDRVHDAVLSRAATRRAERQYPGIPEYSMDYEHNRLLQEVEPGSNVFVPRSGAVYVLEYHRGADREDVRIHPFRPEAHTPLSLVTVWSEDFHKPVHRITPDRFARMEREELERRRSQRRFSVDARG